MYGWHATPRCTDLEHVVTRKTWPSFCRNARLTEHVTVGDATCVQDATQPQDGYRRLLSDGADQMRQLESLRAAGVLKRGEAWKLAVMNCHLPHLTMTSTYWGGYHGG